MRLAIFILVTSLMVPLICAADTKKTPQELLLDALLCRNDSLDAVREIVAKHPFDIGIAAATWAREMDEKNVVIVKNGLRVGSAVTHAVITQFDTTYERFQGIVFGEFQGDYISVVKDLKLSPTRNDDADAMAMFISARPKGEKDEICPPTILLTPLEGNRFVLGCGWCNG